MRAREFIYPLNEEELQEIDMSPSGLKRQAANINATVGIEFEMIVPGVKGSNDYAEPERDYDHNPRTRSISDIEEFFFDGDYNSRRDVARLIEDLTERYNEWQEEQFQNRWAVDKTEMIYEYVRYELDDDIIAELLGFNADNRPEGFTRAQLATVAEMIADDPENQWHDEAMDYARSSFYENTDTGEWLTEMGLERMSDVEGQFDITWPYWNVPDDDEDVDVNAIGQDFSAAVGKKVNVSKSYHGGKREPDKYVVEPDGSLDPEGDDDVGLEFISPPLPLAEMLDQLKLVITWAKNNNCYTNRSTGLHMNVSVPNFSRDQLDYVKLALLLGDEYILDSFGRSSNTYTKSAMMKVRDRVASQPADAEQLLQAMKGHLDALASRAIHSGNTDKYTSINTKDKYIEFRSPGGDWLNEDLGKLEATILRFVVALDAAMNPEKHRNEYLSKLRKLLTAGQKQNDDIIQHFVQYSSGTLPKQALKSFIKQAQLQRKITKNPTDGERYWWKVQIGPAAIEVVAKDNQEAWTVALKNQPLWTKYSIQQAEIVPLRPYKDETPKEPTVTVGQGQSGQAQTAEPIGRVRAAGPSQPAWRAPGAGTAPRAGVPQGQEVIERLLGMADQAADANYEIVRRDTYQPVFLFIANTPQVASRVLERYLDLIGADADSEDFGFRERARPGSTLDIQRQRAEQSARAAVQSTGNRLWQIVNSADGEVAYEFYLSRENNQQDANEVGLRWVRNNGDPTTTYSVREQPQQTGTVTPQNQEGSVQWRILVGGEEVHRFWNRINQGEANTAARAWVRDQIRRGLLSPAEGADVEVVPVPNSGNA